MYYFPTTIDKFRRCPLSYRNYRRHKNLAKAFVHRESTWVGDVTHFFMEMVFRAGAGMNTDFEDVWNRAWCGHLQRKIPPEGFWVDDKHEERVKQSSLFQVTDFLKQHPHLFDLRVIGAEQWCHADYPNCPLGIKADLVAQYPNGTHVVLDWKSGKTPYHRTLAKYMEHDSQIPVSGLVAGKMYHTDTPRVEIYWIAAGHELVCQFDEAMLRAWEEYYRKLILHIGARTEWGPVKNKLCDWCDWQKISTPDGQKLCPLFDDQGKPV